MKASELKSQFRKTRSITSPSYKRVEQISTDKIEMAISMIKNAVKKLKTVDYVLADSWFICEKFISEINKIKVSTGNKLNVIGLMKSNRIITIEGQKINGNKVPELKRKSIRHNRMFKADYLDFIAEYKGVSMRVFWVKMKGQNNWKMLICTDKKLSFTKEMK